MAQDWYGKKEITIYEPVQDLPLNVSLICSFITKCRQTEKAVLDYS